MSVISLFLGVFNLDILRRSSVDCDATEIAGEIYAETEQTHGLNHRPLERVVVNS